MSSTIEGFVLKVINYGNSQVIVHLYTREYGKIAVIASKNNKKSGNSYFQPLFQIQAKINYKESRNINRISNISLFHPYKNIAFSIVKSSIVQFIAEILNKTITENQIETELYDFMIYSLNRFDTSTNNYTHFHIYFIVWLAKFLGIAPKIETNKYFTPSEGIFTKIPAFDSFSLKHSILLKELLQCNVDNFESIKLDTVEIQEMMKLMINYFKYHFNIGKIKSHEVLTKIFE